MHTMVLGFAGYGLLLSSCVTIIFLLRMGCIKDILRSPLHILSTSDTLISMITSIILLINQSVPLTTFEQDTQISDANEIVSWALLQDDDSGKYDKNQTCMRFYNKYDSWPDSQAINGTTSNCTFRHVLMHYAMFLLPFANTFISLLIYSVQCSSGMSGVDEKCSSLTQVSQDMNKDLKIGNGIEQPPAPSDPDLNFRQRDSAQADVNIISKDPKVDEKTHETILTVSDSEASILTNANNVQKFTGFGLITQWLVPILVTAILYFSKAEDMNKLRESNEMECIFKMNYPLESCNKVELAKIETSKNPNANYDELTVEVEDPDTLRISYPDSEAIDKVVSNVRNVVQSVLNNTCNNATELKYYNSSRPWNITKYITMKNLTQQMSNDETEMLEKLTHIQQALNNNDLGISRTNKCTATNTFKDSIKTDQEIQQDEELRLFEDVLESARFETPLTLPLPRPEAKPQDLFSQEVTTPAKIITHQYIQMTHINDTADKITGKKQTAESLYTTSNESKTENPRQNINSQIYADIIKRIRDTVIQAKVKGQTGNLRDNYEDNNEKLRTSKPEISSLSFRSRKIREDRENSFTEYKDERLTQAAVDMDEHCFLSTKFLKIHLLILLFFIYFIPVLVSGILQTRAIYMCKNVFEKIEAVDSKNLKISQISGQNKMITNENSFPKPGWFLDESDNPVKTNLANSRNIDAPNASGSSQRATERNDETKEYDSQLEDRKTVYKNVLHETRSMQMLFSILTKSLMLGVLMWTPAFLEILSKVFLCASTPAWLVNVLYLLGISFGIVKNFFNVIIAKINKNINDQIYGKENSVHPSA